MSEHVTIERGQWWFSNDNQTRCYICGFDPDGDPVFLTEPTLRPDTDTMVDFLACWHHEPRCTGWEWQPEPELEWFDLTPFDSHQMRVQTDYAYYLPHDQSGEWRHTSAVFSVSTVGELKKLGYTQFRCLLKDAPKPSAPSENAYGRCPICGAAGKSRERRINGNDACENGHLYPSKDAIYGDATPAAEDPDEWVTITVQRRDLDGIRNAILRLFESKLPPL